jgi:hypothetical protein
MGARAAQSLSVPVNIRDHRDIVVVSVVAEPGCIVFCELCVNRFQSAFSIFEQKPEEKERKEGCIFETGDIYYRYRSRR